LSCATHRLAPMSASTCGIRGKRGKKVKRRKEKKRFIFSLFEYQFICHPFVHVRPHPRSARRTKQTESNKVKPGKEKEGEKKGEGARPSSRARPFLAFFVPLVYMVKKPNNADRRREYGRRDEKRRKGTGHRRCGILPRSPVQALRRIGKKEEKKTYVLQLFSSFTSRLHLASRERKKEKRERKEFFLGRLLAASTRTCADGLVQGLQQEGKRIHSPPAASCRE